MTKLFLICVAMAVVAAQAIEYLKEIKETPGVRGAIKAYKLGRSNDDIKVSKNRNAIKGRERLWPDGVIPYTYTTQYTATLVAVIDGAMKAIQDNTCITFVPRTTQANYITFAANPNGQECSSWVGLQNTGEQVVTLSHGTGGTCLAHQVVVHELFHAIGLDHEQNRADRDNFIAVAKSKVDPGKMHNYDTVDPMDFFDYGCPYTYESVMHYDKSSFALVPGDIIMNPVDQTFLNIIGNAKKAHANDYEKINRIYKCDVAAVAGTTCGVQPQMPCEDGDPYCAEVAKFGCDYADWTKSWKPVCRKTCNTCNV